MGTGMVGSGISSRSFVDYIRRSCLEVSSAPRSILHPGNHYSRSWRRSEKKTRSIRRILAIA